MAISISEQINPYIIGRPIYEPEHFFGRNDLFAFIQDNLSQKNKVILLHGQRRIGKSSILSQVPNFVKLDDFVFVILSLEGKSKKSLNDVLYELAKEIKSYLEDELEFSLQDIKVPPREVFQKDFDVFTWYFLPQIYEVLASKKLVLLLDEFDVLENDYEYMAIKHFFPYLQSIINKQHQLSIIPVIGRRLGDISSLLQLFREAPHQEIGLLRKENAEKLILEPAKGILEYEDAAVDAVLELTSGHPYFTQVVCFALFSKAREDEKTIITCEDVEGIADRAIDLAGGGLTWFRDGLEIPERLILLVTANIQKSENSNFPKYPLAFLQEIGVSITGELKNAEKNLVDWNFCKSNLQGYQIIIELVRLWLINRFSVDKEIAELQRFYVSQQRSYGSQHSTNEERLPSGIECPKCSRHTVVSISPNLWKCLNCDFSKDFSRDENNKNSPRKNIIFRVVNLAAMTLVIMLSILLLVARYIFSYTIDSFSLSILTILILLQVWASSTRY